MAGLGGLAAGFLDAQQSNQQQQQADLQRKILLQQLAQSQLAQQQQQEQYKRQMAARSAAGNVLMGQGGQQQLPQPPMPGQSSAPQPGAGAPPQGGGMPPPPQAAAPQPGGGPMPPPQGWKPMPAAPQGASAAAPQAGGQAQLPPPPAPQQPDTTAGAGAGGIDQPKPLNVPGIMASLKQQGVPTDSIMDVMDQLTPVMTAENKQQLDQVKLQLKFQEDMNKFQHEWIVEHQGQERLDQGDRRLDQGDKRDAMMEKRLDAYLSNQSGSGGFDQQDIDYWSDVLRKGGALPPRLATTPGGKKLTADIMKAVARAPNASADDMLANQAEFQGQKAGERTLGTRAANIRMAATEAAGLSQLALKASDEWERSGVKSLNDLEKFAQGKTASPDLRRFVAANTSFINAYARAINPQGVGTVDDKKHAREMLEVGFTKGDYAAAINQLQAEIATAEASPGKVKDEMREEFTGKSVARAQPGPTIDQTGKKSSPPAAGTVEGGYKFKGGDPADQSNWVKQ